jgi:hypothetical protein
MWPFNAKITFRCCNSVAVVQCNILYDGLCLLKQFSFSCRKTTVISSADFMLQKYKSLKNTYLPSKGLGLVRLNTTAGTNDDRNLPVSCMLLVKLVSNVMRNYACFFI